MSRLCLLILMVLVFLLPSIASAWQVPEPALPPTLEEALGPVLRLSNDSAAQSAQSPSMIREPARLEGSRFTIERSDSALVASPELGQSFNSFNNSNVYRKPTPAIPAKPLPPKNAPAPSIPMGRNSTTDTAPDDVDPPPFFLVKESSETENPSRRGAAQRSNRVAPVVQTFGDSPQQSEPQVAVDSPQLATGGGTRNRLDSPLAADFATSSLRVKVLASDLILAGQTNDFTVEVFNLAPGASAPVEVNIAIPDGLTITRFDRDAWLNERDRTIAFSLPSIPGRHKQAIRLQGISHVKGRHDLLVSLESEEQLLDRRTLAMEVLDGSEAMRNATSENATDRLPFPRPMNR